MHLHSGRRLGEAELIDLLTEARERTLLLVGTVSDDDLLVQHDPLMSPIIWDLGHIGHFEEVWLVESVERGSDGSEGLRGMYNPFENPRSVRASLELPGLGECRELLKRARASVMDLLPTLDMASDDALLRDGFVFRMVLQHEYQHNETILQTLQLKRGEPYSPPHRWSVPESPATHPFDAMVDFPGGRVEVGTDDRSAAYDNERPKHEVDLAPFSIDAAPVTEGAFRDFIAAGGYREREHWSEEGWAWLEEAGVEAPKHWRRNGAGWTVRTMDRVRTLDPSRPVCHVCFHEAEAYARFAGKRLPTEIEWEAAATWDPKAGSKSSFPWGDEPPTRELANIDALSFQTAPVGSYPRNVSPIGCYGMIGDVWEWTSSDFGGYAGFETFPYPEYSEVFFGNEYKVLRGGAWATRTGAIRGTFRTGTTRSAVRSSAGFDVPGTPEGLMVMNAEAGARARMLEDIRWGLTQPQKQLSSKYFYDTLGSELFEAITQLPEYYLTRSERRLLQDSVAHWLVDLAPTSLVELGAGSAQKTRILLSAMSAVGRGRVYAPVDVAGEFLAATAAALGRDYPSLTIRPQVKDITTPLAFADDLSPPVLFALLGSTLGNFEPGADVALLANVRSSMKAGDAFLMGADLRPGAGKSIGRLEAAYNDAQGITERFNLNILANFNREVGTDFDLSAFRHKAFYSEDFGRIEMHLEALSLQEVEIPGSCCVRIEQGETIRTELSCKYDRPTIEGLFDVSGLRLDRWCEEEGGLYAMVLGTPV